MQEERTPGAQAAALELPGSPGGTEARSAPLGLRGWCLAFVTQAVILIWVVRSELTGRVFLSSWTLSMPGVLLLVSLLLWNSIRRGRPLGRAELMAAFVATSATVTLAGYNFLQLLVPLLGSPFLASVENRWGRVLDFVPAWLLPQDNDALRGLFHGESVVPWEAWLAPLLLWSTLVAALALAGLALNALMADLWIRKERLAFPIAALPLEMIQQGTPLWRNRVLWLGVLLPVVQNSLLALHHYWPDIPAYPHKHQDIIPTPADPPWSVLRPIVVGSTPFILGLAFLAPLDVSFSVWAFYWLGKAQRLAAFWTGWMDANDLGARGAPYLNEQTVGAFLGLGAMLLGRGLLHACTRAAGTEDPPLHRVLWWTLGLSITYVFAFLVISGFSAALAGGLLLLYFLTVITISRVRSEAGFSWAYGPDRGVASLGHIVIGGHGSIGLAPRDVALLGFFQWLWWDLRFSLMPAQMDALKLADAGGMQRRQVLALLAAATVLAAIVAPLWIVQDSYTYGWGTAKTYAGPMGGLRSGFSLANLWLTNPTAPRWDKTGWIAGGAGFTLLLGVLRQRFVWWPLHPIGYAMAATVTAHAFWSHYFCAWLCKLLLLRYGGMRLYRQALPFVFGLILGDVASQSLWSIGASLLDVPVYQFVS